MSNVSESVISTEEPYASKSLECQIHLADGTELTGIDDYSRLALKSRPQLRRIRLPSAVAFRLPPGPTIDLTSARAVGPSGSPE
jgi:hypothetical protein